ncbi:hypothetical protein [Mucilaginibacter segetis]|uniref:Uncharacterized protein n=1 Tax=Mucilaginibacter segetis TaxID=2793071 RepID=A0A934PS47_9SPHI|nr:hypothetical protein [Mucilaginibacter segetis]MBK0378420.1 hypothetical protein [Mucilaginibacter segetis]
MSGLIMAAVSVETVSADVSAIVVPVVSSCVYADPEVLLLQEKKPNASIIITTLIFNFILLVV